MEIYVNKHIDIVINSYHKKIYIYDLKKREEYKISWVLMLYLLILDSGKTLKLDDEEQEKINYWVTKLYDNNILTHSANDNTRLSNVVRYELEKTLKNVQIEITNKCNFNCKHCFNSHHRNAVLPYDIIKKLLMNVKRLE